METVAVNNNVLVYTAVAVPISVHGSPKEHIEIMISLYTQTTNLAFLKDTYIHAKILNFME
jgi:hypothetical protein